MSAGRVRLARRVVLGAAVVVSAWAGDAIVSTQEALAIVCGHTFACGTDGYRFLRPLAGRTVEPNHRIVVEIIDTFAAVSPPELRLLDGTELPSEWVSIFDGRNRYERIGAPLPVGNRVQVGDARPRTCTYWVTEASCGSSHSECAEGVSDDCCLFGDEDVHPWRTHLWFDVAGEPMEDAAPAAGYSAGEQSLPAEDGGLDAGAATLGDSGFAMRCVHDAADAALIETESASVVEAGSDHSAAVSDAPSLAPPPFALRCSIGSGETPVDLYLDLGNETVDSEIVEIDLEVTTTDERLAMPIERHLRWEAMPCVGQALRDFRTLSNSFATATEFLEDELSSQLHQYQISVGGEAGFLAAGAASVLRVPEDCVPADEISLDWQQGRFTARCDPSVPEFSLHERFLELNMPAELDYSCENLSRDESVEPDTPRGVLLLEPEPTTPASPSDPAVHAVSVGSSTVSAALPTPPPRVDDPTYDTSCAVASSVTLSSKRLGWSLSLFALAALLWRRGTRHPRRMDGAATPRCTTDEFPKAALGSVAGPPARFALELRLQRRISAGRWTASR